MSRVKISNKELVLSFERFLVDSRDDFFPDPFQYADLQLVRDDILQQVHHDLLRALQSSRVSYATLPYCDWDVPKKNYIVRHAVCLHPIDRIVYSFILQRLAGRIEPHLSSARYSYRMARFDRKWPFGRRIVKQWMRFRDDIKKHVAKISGDKFIVSTDIAGFFEYVHLMDFKKQMYNLCRVRKEDKIIELLYSFVRSCSPSYHSGIPQNYDPSSYLASAFLDFLDKDLEGTGLKQFRYVDDIKVICTTKRDAQKAIIEIIRSLRKLNLNLATHKTEIWHHEDVEFKEFIRDFPAILEETDRAVERKTKALVNDCLQKLVTDLRRIVQRRAEPIDERLFRAYIWRVVKCHRFSGINKPDLSSINRACLRLLEKEPDRTDALTRFLTLHKDRKYVQEGIAALIENTVYPWQELHLWALMTQSDRIKTEKLKVLARRRLRDTSHSEAARSYAMIFLGKHGNYQDRNTMAEMIKTPSSFFTTRCILVALQEHPDRKAIFNRHLQLTDDLVIKGLLKYLLQSKKPIYPSVVDRIGEDRFIS